MLTLYLVRHGWTAWHDEGRVAGWSDVSLNGRGRSEAEATGRWLARHCPEHPPTLIASPVRRAHETARIMASAFDPPLQVVVEPGFAETRVPDWEGRLSEEIVSREPTWQDFYKGPADFRFPGGETGREVQARAVAAVEALRLRQARGEAILVSHADPLRGLIAHYLGLEANHYYRLRIDCGSITRLSLRALDHSGRPRPPARLDFLNLTEHLDGIVRS